MRVFAIEPNAELPAAAGRESAGNKGFNLLKLAALGLPVPAGFILSTDFCRAGDAGQALRTALMQEVAGLERRTGLGFGSDRAPLLLSVRSGAAASMPGMMETLLNIGLSDRTLPGLIAMTGNPRLAWDCYRRLIQQFAETVFGVTPAVFEAPIAETLAETGAANLAELDTLTLRALVRRLAQVFADATGTAFPQDPAVQLAAAVDAVLRSWQAPRAVTYRRMHGLDDLPGTAVTMQRMVFGNAGSTSGSGVGFTRDPASGARGLYLDYVANGQGEDVVSGRGEAGSRDLLERLLPASHAELLTIADRLEAAFGDAQDFEFTIENGRLYLLQTRDAKRSPWASLRMAVEMASEGLIAPAEARRRVSQIDPSRLVRHRIDPGDARPVGTAIPASQGVVAGRIALDSAAAERMAGDGPVILIRNDIATDDVGGMAAAVGILTAKGNRTSHGAVVARQMDKICLVACTALRLEPTGGTIGSWSFVEGDTITLDGNEGQIYAGLVPVRAETPDSLLAALAVLEEKAA